MKKKNMGRPKSNGSIKKVNMNDVVEVYKCPHCAKLIKID